MDAHVTCAMVVVQEAMQLARELKRQIDNDRATTADDNFIYHLIAKTTGLLSECITRSLGQAPGPHGIQYRTLDGLLREKIESKIHYWLAKEMEIDFDAVGVYCTCCQVDAVVLTDIIAKDLLNLPLVDIMQETSREHFYDQGNQEGSRSLEQENDRNTEDENDSSEDDVQGRVTISTPELREAFYDLQGYLESEIAEAINEDLCRIVESCSSPTEILDRLKDWYISAGPMTSRTIFDRTFGRRRISIWGDTADEIWVINGINDFIADNLYRELLMNTSMYIQDGRFFPNKLKILIFQMIYLLPLHVLIPATMMTFGEENTPVRGNIYDPPQRLPPSPPPEMAEFEPCLAEDLIGQYGPENVHLDAISEEFPPGLGGECSICGTDNNHVDENCRLRRLDVCSHTICNSCLQGNIDSRMKYRYRCPFCRTNMLGLNDEEEVAQTPAVEEVAETPAVVGTNLATAPRARLILVSDDEIARYRADGCLDMYGLTQAELATFRVGDRLVLRSTSGQIVHGSVGEQPVPVPVPEVEMANLSVGDNL